MYPESIRESIFHKSNDADFWLVPLPLFEELPRSMFPVNKRKKNITEPTTGKSIVINGGSERKNGRKIMCKLAAVVINVLCPPIK